MSSALPGNHYCSGHQGNGAHYAPGNCHLCWALLARAAKPTEPDEMVAFSSQDFEELRRINLQLYGDGQSLDAQDRTPLADALARALAAGIKARILP